MSAKIQIAIRPKKPDMPCQKAALRTTGLLGHGCIVSDDEQEVLATQRSDLVSFRQGCDTPVCRGTGPVLNSLTPKCARVAHIQITPNEGGWTSVLCCILLARNN